jgi:hypothetical protein
MIVAQLDRDRLLELPLSEFGGASPGQKERFRVEFPINDPRGVIGWEAFEPNRATEWSFWHDEFHVCLGGSAEVELTLPPNHGEVLSQTIGTGDAVLILAGTRARFHVGDEPYVHVCLIAPRFEYAKYLLTEDYARVAGGPRATVPDPGS